MPVTILPPLFVPKVWGSTQLEPWFANPPERIGEVWFPVGALLIKFLFTSENLSLQVHPDDAYAARVHGSRGKTEMWHVLRAAPDAAVAMGLLQALGDPQELRQAAESGQIMELVQWFPAHRGDTFFIPAGTVHAIGAGLALCEIQQNSDVTYRLYDYGRDRELHLDHAVKVAHIGPHAGASHARQLAAGRARLVDCPYFHTDALDLHGPSRVLAHLNDRIDAVVVLEGELEIDEVRAVPGNVVQVSGAEDLWLQTERGCSLLLVTAQD